MFNPGLGRLACRGPDRTQEAKGQGNARTTETKEDDQLSGVYTNSLAF